jgi:two-component system cell cycle sensor histidine kinase/response regulator CckA
MSPLTIGLFHCSQHERAAVRSHLAGMAGVTFAEDCEPRCDFAIVGSMAGERRAVLAALREKIGSTPALLLVDSADDEESELATLPRSELAALPFAIRYEVRRHRADARRRAIVEEAADIIYTVDVEGRITSLNAAFERATAWRIDEWIGRNLSELITTVNDCDSCIVRKSGEVRAVEVASRPLMANGEQIGSVGIARDVTERRRAAIHREKEQRLASLGQLAGSVAHEFNNVLMSILPFAELIRRRFPEDERIDKATNHILDAVRRGRQVSREILRLAKPVVATMTTVDINDWLAGFAREASATLGSRYRLETRRPTERLFANADRALLSQTAMNVLVNARDAMPSGGTVTIDAQRTPSGDIEISIRDEGTGIASDVVDRIFDPLFTTKPAASGLGLSIAYQAMMHQQGTLRVSSEVGTGSTFTFSVREAPAPALNAHENGAAVRKILLVEDDESVGEGISALLLDEGFEVRLVTRGKEVPEAVGELKPDLVLLDVNLPDISGFEVYENVARLWPELRVIFSTGHADARILGEVRRRDVPSIMKPYDISELLAMIARPM